MKSLGELRECSVAEIAKELFKNHNMDPDVAIIAAWGVNHKNSPKNWSGYFERVSNKMNRLSKWPSIPKQYVKYIMEIYELNKIEGKGISLL